MADMTSVNDAAYDFSIAGLYFNAAVTQDNPAERAFARVSKEMINTSPQPGDAALDGWWIRSATDWTGGAGYEFMEPIDQEPIPKTYAFSYGVDPWSTPGQISLLQKPFQNVGYPVPKATGFQYTSAIFGPYVIVAGAGDTASLGSNVWRETLANFSIPNNKWEPSRDPFLKAPSLIRQLAVGQGRLLAVTDKDGIIEIKLDGQGWRPIFTVAGASRIWYVKDRWVVAAGPNLYEAVAKDAAQELSKPIYTSPDPAFTWTACTSTPSAILVAGRSAPGNDPYSAIFAMTLTSVGGGAPTLTAPTVTAEFPAGEYVQDIKSYLGTYLLISTTRGVRLGLIGDNGQITYGPLLGCIPLRGSFAVSDKFAWAPVYDAGEGRGGVVRFDLSNVTDEQKVAWSYDYRMHDPIPSTEGGYMVNKVMAVPDANVLIFMAQSWRGGALYSVQPGCSYEEYGVIQSGQIRMGSTVPKNWARFSLYAQQNMQGQVKAEIVTPTGTYDIGVLANPEHEEEWTFAEKKLNSVHASIRLTLSRGALPPGPPPPPPPPPPPDPPGPPPAPGEESWNSLRTKTWQEVKDSGLRWEDLGRNIPVKIEGGVDATSVTTEGTPVVEGWALRGTPAIERTELIRVGLLCFDFEKNSQGLRLGADGNAIKRYRALAEALAPNTVVEFKDLNNNISDFVSVDEMSYRQTAAPSFGSGFGGTIDLVLRVL